MGECSICSSVHLSRRCACIFGRDVFVNYSAASLHWVTDTTRPPIGQIKGNGSLSLLPSVTRSLSTKVDLRLPRALHTLKSPASPITSTPISDLFLLPSFSIYHQQSTQLNHPLPQSAFFALRIKLLHQKSSKTTQFNQNDWRKIRRQGQRLQERAIVSCSLFSTIAMKTLIHLAPLVARPRLVSHSPSVVSTVSYARVTTLSALVLVCRVRSNLIT